MMFSISSFASLEEARTGLKGRQILAMGNLGSSPPAEWPALRHPRRVASRIQRPRNLLIVSFFLLALGNSGNNPLAL